MTQERARKAMTISSRILLVLAILAAIMIGVLKLAERSKEPLRLGLQDYLTQTSGHPAEIALLEKAQLFPNLAFLIKDIVIRDKDDRDKVLVKADSAAIAMSFWKTFFGITSYQAIKIENLEMASGYVLPKKLALSFAGISDPLTNVSPPFFLMEGTYNKLPLLITAQMERHGNAPYSYDFDSAFPVTFKLGGTEANAVFKRGLTQVDFAQITLVRGEQEALLSALDMQFNPVRIPLKGKIVGVPIEGLLSKEADGYKLSISTLNADDQSIAAVRKFMDGLSKDFGIDDASGIVIEIHNDTESQDDKEVRKE